MAAGLALAAFAVAIGVASVAHKRQPAVALALWPGHARATLNMAKAHVAADGIPKARAVGYAREAILRDPALPLAFVLVSQEVGRSERQTRAALAYSRKLTRRDLPTTMLLMKQALLDNDLKLGLRQLDYALTTSEVAEELVTPMLLQQTAVPAIVDPLADLLAREPSWRRSFTLRAINESPAPANIGRLALRLRELGTPIDEAFEIVLINRLVGEEELDLAWQLYQQRFPSRSRLTIRPFEDRAGEASRFDWSLANESDLWAEASSGQGKDARLEFFVSAGAAGPVARQLVKLEPGEYQVSFDAGLLEGSETASPRLTIACAGGQTLREIDASSSRTVSFGVPAAQCPMVNLVFSVRGNFTRSSGAGWIKDIRIKPVS